MSLQRIIAFFEEMFPDATTGEILQALQSSGGNVDRAINVLVNQTQRKLEETDPYGVFIPPYEVERYESYGYPFIDSKEQLQGLEAVMDKQGHGQFALSRSFAPDFIDAAARRGFFPMAIPVSRRRFACAIKVHRFTLRT
jgi:hypothetical protein